MRLGDLLARPPLLHIDEHGAPISYAVNDRVLEIIDRLARPEMSTVETGAGLSTIVFAIAGTQHTAITDKRDETKRILAFCAEHGIDASRTTFQVGDSADLLPTLQLNDIGFALIDGRHAFPSPFLDWYYMSRAMKVGGLLIVDDTQLWTGEVLREFLIDQPGWALEADLPMSSCFRLTAPVDHVAEWTSQPFVTKRLAANAAPTPRRGVITSALRRLRPGSGPQTHG